MELLSALETLLEVPRQQQATPLHPQPTMLGPDTQPLTPQSANTHDTPPDKTHDGPKPAVAMPWSLSER